MTVTAKLKELLIVATHVMLDGEIVSQHNGIPNGGVDLRLDEDGWVSLLNDTLTLDEEGRAHVMDLLGDEYVIQFLIARPIKATDLTQLEQYGQIH